MFSATWPKEIQKLASRFCSINPVHVKIGDQSGHDGMTVNKNIEQVIHVVNDFNQKRREFVELLQKVCKDAPQKIIIFCKTKKGCDGVERNLNRDRDLASTIKYDARAIHGDKE